MMEVNNKNIDRFLILTLYQKGITFIKGVIFGILAYLS